MRRRKSACTWAAAVASIALTDFEVDQRISW
jgi:hypothetical protein